MSRGVTDAVVIMTKAPEPGRSKTRLCPPLSAAEAAAVAEAALRDTLDAVAATRCGRRVVALDGVPGDWLPDGFEVIVQRGGGLDERLAHAIEDVAAPAVIIAMDTPQVTAALLDDALDRLDRLDRLERCDAVLGPTDDGGYWCIGLADHRRNVITGVPMSRAGTWAAQVQRLEQAGLSWERLDGLVDVDEVADAVAVASMIPDSRFGRLVRSLLGDGVGEQGPQRHL